MTLEQAFQNENFMRIIDNEDFQTAFEVLDTAGRDELYSLLEAENINPLTNFKEQIQAGLFERVLSINTLIIPHEVTSIKRYAFRACENLTIVDINNNVTNINYGAFSSCINLKSIKFSQNLQAIGDQAFSFCDKLTFIRIPDSVEFIGESAFEQCKQLKQVILGKHTLLSPAVFSLCQNLQYVGIQNPNITLTPYLFRWCTKLNRIRFNGTIEQWKALNKADKWNYKMPECTIICLDGEYIESAKD